MPGSAAESAIQVAASNSAYALLNAVDFKHHLAVVQNQNQKICTLQLRVRRLRVGEAHALLATDASLQSRDELIQGDQK
jgi:hypothetical protein